MLITPDLRLSLRFTKLVLFRGQDTVPRPHVRLIDGNCYFN